MRSAEMNKADKRFETLIKKLKDSDHKITPQRLAIARSLVDLKDHPSVENIYEKLKTDYPTMSLATVYRNVMLIKSLGEVLELGFPDGSNRYDGMKPYPHPHVICVRCRKIIDPDLSTLQDMTKEVAHKTDFTILTHQLTFFGICGNCKSKPKEKSDNSKEVS
jgi:Fur family transcriptional regulator, peroxide stress response regulator